MLLLRVHSPHGLIGTFWFQSVPKSGEEISIPTLVGPKIFTVLQVRHVAGDPTDNNPPAFSEVQVK